MGLRQAVEGMRKGEDEMALRTGSNSASCAQRQASRDDDARNIFALTALLENQELGAITANNGRAAINRIRETPDLNIAPIDFITPKMDGYERMRKARKSAQVRPIPHPANPRAHRESEVTRPGVVPLRRRERLLCEAGEHRPTPVAHVCLAFPLRNQPNAQLDRTQENARSHPRR